MAQPIVIRHEFAASALPDDTFRVVEFVGVEDISQPYRIELSLVSNNPDIEFAHLIDQAATLEMYRGDDPIEVNGIVIDFEQASKADVESDYQYLYRAVLAPRLWRCALSFQSRIFQNLTVEEIVTQILDDAGVDHRFDLAGSYEPREFTTQYKETDLQFIQRLLEFEGIRYYFTHADGVETLILSDDASDAPDIDGEAETPYRFQGGLMAADDREFVGDFVARQQLVTAKTKLKDYNYRTPEQELLAESEIDPELAVGIESDYGTHVMDAGRNDRLVVIRNEEIESTRIVMTGRTDCLRFRVGQCFSLVDHYRDGLNQTYLITHIDVRGSQAGAAAVGASADAGSGYVCEFRCVPASVPYRPPRITPVPKLPGVLTAKVESSGGTYAPVDDQGRYRVRMPFDVGDSGDAQATKPVRLAQPYTGPGYGQHFPVHKEAEMVVACVDGNVDRVLGLSTIYNPTQFSPVTSSNAAHNVLRSWGENELTFDDTQGAELVFMHATKDHHSEIVDNQLNTVGTNRTQTVGQDETMSVGRDQAEDVGQDASLQVGRDQSIGIGATRMITVGTSHTETIGSSMSLSVGTTMTETVAISKSTSVGAANALSVGGAHSVTVGAQSSETVGGTKGIDAGGNISVSSAASVSVSAGKDYDLEVGKKSEVKIGDDGTYTTGKNFTLTVGKKAVIKVSDQLTLKCGKAEIVLKKNGDISIKGKKIDLKASGKMTLKGSQIAEN